MNKFNVKLDKPESIEKLKPYGKVGKPQVLTTYVIFETNLNRMAVMGIEGVLEAEPDMKLDIGYVSTNQSDAPQWALPWISHSNDSYVNARSGVGVDIYVIDTGVRDTHSDLIGRVRNLWSFDDVFWSTEGEVEPTHGTSVAACAAGTLYGTAKNATIVNVRIDFYNSTLIKALDVILKDHLSKDATRPSIVNFSATSPMKLIGDLFDELPKYGIIPVAASGNNGQSEPLYPAKSWWTLAVGALDSQGNPAYFTNRKCEVYAPGQGVPTAHVNSDTASTIISGTSFSSPYVAGLMACLLEGSDRFNTSSQVSAFQFNYYMNLCNTGRIPSFDNGGYGIRTSTSLSTLPGDWYDNISLTYSNQDIYEFVMANLNNPQVIADAARDGNVDANRLSQVLGYDVPTINEWFRSQGVRTWWMTDDVWNNTTSSQFIPEDSASMRQNHKSEYKDSPDKAEVMLSLFTIGFLLGVIAAKMF